MTFDEVMKLKRLVQNIRDASNLSNCALNAIDELDKELTVICNKQTKESGERARLLSSIENSVSMIRDLPMCKRQAD